MTENTAGTPWARECPICGAPIQDARQIALAVDASTGEAVPEASHLCAVAWMLSTAWDDAIQSADTVDAILADAAANS